MVCTRRAIDFSFGTSLCVWWYHWWCDKVDSDQFEPSRPRFLGSSFARAGSFVSGEL